MKKKKGGKNSIVKDLMATGLTARKAAKAVNAVIDFMTLALWWGEPVEIPGGSIQATFRQGQPRTELQKFSNIQTKDLALHMVHYSGRRRVVTFTPDLKLDLSPLPVLPLSETPEEVEMRQLVLELMGKPANKPIMAKLQEALEAHPHQPGSLLRRLQEFRSRGWQFSDLDSLARQVSFHHWL